jgi:glycolate oxidase iron-sulfur subunit
LADQNVGAFSWERLDAIVVNHAGCGAMLKEYPHHWPDEHQSIRRAFSKKVRDINEFLEELGPVRPEGEIRLRATYHDACHLAHAQKIVDPPRRLLRLIGGLELVELPESLICCGSAGTYNLLQPAMADRLARRKLENIRATGAEVVLASNAGCLLQIMREVRRARLPVLVLHPMELLDMAYRGLCPTIPSRKFSR